MPVIARLTNSDGFTLVELVIAMALFSFMLMIVVSGYLTIARLQQAGVASRDSQQAGRFAIEDMVRQIRDADQVAVVSSPPADAICLYGVGGATKYYMVAPAGGGGSFGQLRKQVITNFDPTKCGGIASSASDEVITPPQANVVKFQAERIQSVSGSDGGADTIQLSVLVASTNDPALISGTSCLPGVAGAQYCAVTAYTSSAELRERTP